LGVIHKFSEFFFDTFANSEIENKRAKKKKKKKKTDDIELESNFRETHLHNYISQQHILLLALPANLIGATCLMSAPNLYKVLATDPFCVDKQILILDTHPN